MKFKGVAKLISVNLLVLVGLFALVNLLSLVVLEGYLLTQRVVRGPPTEDIASQWWSLPVYADQERSRTLYDEFFEIGYHYEPFIAWSRSQFEGVGTTINEAGDRVHVPPAWGGDKIGVVRFFGGSTMWGTGADDQGTIAAIYNESNPQVTVHNHGESGQNSRQSLDRLITLASRDAPMTVVVFYEGVNEISNCQAGEDGPTHAQVSHLRKFIGQPAPPDDFFHHLRGVSRTLLMNRTVEFAAAVRDRMPAGGQGAPIELKRWDCDDDPVKTEAAARILLRNWEMARAIVEARGGRFIAVLQPHAHVGSPETEHVTHLLREDVGATLGVLYQAIQGRLAEAGHDWTYDMTEAWDDEGPVLIDDFHVTEAGNRVIAERIHAILSAESG